MVICRMVYQCYTRIIHLLCLIFLRLMFNCIWSFNIQFWPMSDLYNMFTEVIWSSFLKWRELTSAIDVAASREPHLPSAWPTNPWAVCQRKMPTRNHDRDRNLWYLWWFKFEAPRKRAQATRVFAEVLQKRWAKAVWDCKRFAAWLSSFQMCSTLITDHLFSWSCRPCLQEICRSPQSASALSSTNVSPLVSESHASKGLEHVRTVQVLTCFAYAMLCYVVLFLSCVLLFLLCVYILDHILLWYILCVCLYLFSLMCVHMPVSFMCSHCRHLFRMQ